MCTPQARPDPRLAGFVAPKRNIVNEFKSEITRYSDMESDRDYYRRDNAAYRAWKLDPANAGVSASKRVRLERLRGGEGMSQREGYSSYSKRQKAERAAFDASDLGKANESQADYNIRLKAAQQAYINRTPGTGTTATTGATGATGAPASVAATDKMALRNKQKTAQRASRVSAGRGMLRIGA